MNSFQHPGAAVSSGSYGIAGRFSLVRFFSCAAVILLAGQILAGTYKAQRGEAEILADIAKEPKKAALYAELGSLQSRRNMIEAAERDFKKAIGLDPKCAEAYAGLAGTRLRLKDYAAGRENAQVAVALQPANAFFLSLLARSDMALSRIDEAVDALTKAIALRGKQTDWLYSLLSQCYELKKDYKKSAEIILKQLESRPWDDTIYVEAAKKYYEAGLTAEADRNRRMAGNAWKEYGELKALRDEQARAWEFFKNGRYDEALEIFRKLASANPDKAYFLWSCGIACQRMGDADQAAGYYRLAIEKDPSFERSYSGLGGLAEETRDYVSAESWYRKALEVKPGDVFATKDLMEVLIKEHEWPEAGTRAAELTKLAADEEYYWSALGYISTKLGEDRKAFDAYFQALINSRTRKDKNKYLKKSIDAGLRACNADPSLRPEIARKLLRHMAPDHPDYPVIVRLTEKKQ